MNKLLLCFLFLFIIVSCNENTYDDKQSTFIGGEIINPVKKFVLIGRGNIVIDTIPLNERNFFYYRNDTLSEGLYTFTHNEYQMLYLEPGDSIQLRVNTLEFDETFSFSGKGAEKNNFLMKLFLHNEKEVKSLPKSYLLSPEEFELQLDAQNKSVVQFYKEFKSENSPNKGFRNLAEANIKYSSLLRKELFVSANALRNVSIDIPKSFYSHRQTVDFKNNDLAFYYPYYQFLNHYFDNLSFQKYKKTNSFNRYSYLHNYNKIKIIDSLIPAGSLKNNMVRVSAIRYLTNGNNAGEEKAITDLFDLNNNDSGDHKEIHEIVAASLKITPGNKIPNITVITPANMSKQLPDIISKPSVLYFWSFQSVRHYKDIHERATALQKEYPNYDFIGINTDTHFKRWRSIVQNSGYDVSAEYQFESAAEAEKIFVLNSPNKTMIIDKKGVILKGHTNLFNNDFEEELLGFLNKQKR